MQLFLNCLLNLQSSSILSEIDTERLFCNIPEIYTANRIFWHENINAVVKASRESGNPLDPDMMLNGFVKVRRGKLEVGARLLRPISPKECVSTSDKK